MMVNEAVVHLIDDDASIRESLANLLRAKDLHVRTYECAGAFLKVLPEVEAGCIVTDLQMPQVDGLELIRRVRDFGSNMPVIVISGRSDIWLAAQAARAGAIGFLKKPIDSDLLIASIHSAFACGEFSGTREPIALEQQRSG